MLKTDGQSEGGKGAVRGGMKLVVVLLMRKLRMGLCGRMPVRFRALDRNLEEQLFKDARRFCKNRIR